MTLIASSLQNDIDDLTQRHTSFKQKWLEKQRNISDLLASAVATCKISADDIPHHEQSISKSDITDDSEFEHSFKDYLTKNAPVSINTLAQVFSQEHEQIQSLLKKLNYKLDNDGKIVLPIHSSEQSTNDPLIKSSVSTPLKRSIPSWMSLPTRRGSIAARERPSRQLVHLLSHPTTRELERGNLNAEMDRLLNRQTAMEKMLARRFHTNDTIQEYCQYTTRDECPSVNPHIRRHSRSSSRSSDDDQQHFDEDIQSRQKKRKRNDSNDFNEQNKRLSRYYRKNTRDMSACGKVHFRRLIKSHTDGALGDCSFLNTCFHMVKKRRKNQIFY